MTVAVWATGAAEPVFADAELIDNAVGALTIKAYPTNPGTRWKIWIKWQTVDGVESTSPAGGIHGAEATTGQDVSSLLGALAGSITSTQLSSALNTRINLIDSSSVVAGSVNARILAETNARTTALADEAAARLLALGNEVDARLLADVPPHHGS